MDDIPNAVKSSWRRRVSARSLLSVRTASHTKRAWRLIRRKFPQYKPIGWVPRLTLALRIYDWRQWGITEGPR
jgi:hypothetical protein